MDTVLRIIASASLFDGLPDDQLRAIREIAVERNFRKGQIVFTEGDEGNGFFLIASGTVKIFKASPEGKEHILHIFGPGEPFGEVPVFTGKPFPASAEALSNSRLLFFPRGLFVSLIDKNPSLALNMLAVLARRLRQFTVQIESLSLKEVPSRLASYLIYLWEKQNRKGSITLNISKGQLASLLGTIPETLSRIFSRMSARGLIEVSGREIRLIDPEKLENLAGFGEPEKTENGKNRSTRANDDNQELREHHRTCRQAGSMGWSRYLRG